MGKASTLTVSVEAFGGLMTAASVLRTPRSMSVTASFNGNRTDVQGITPAQPSLK